MASVKDMRTRIGSVKSTQKITKALQMVAAAKLRRAQMAAEAARPYAQRMSAIISNLAGGFNSSIVRAARLKIAALIEEGKDVKIITIGRKARDQMRRQYGNRFVE